MSPRGAREIGPRHRVVHEARFLGKLASEWTEKEPEPEAEAEPAPATRPSFTDFIGSHNASLLDHQHVRKMASCAERVLAGTISRLMVLLPPRYWKSETFSRLLPAYTLRWLPWQVALVCYADSLAMELSEEARKYFEEDGGKLVKGTEAKSRWASVEGGRMWAAGVGAGTLGKGLHLGIIDDPVDPEQVESATYQRRWERFFSGKFLSRQEPYARLIVVMQRLGTADPIDYLLRREVGEHTDRAPQHWHVLALDEVHSEDPLGRWSGPRGLPPTCTLEPDWRKVGEILAPKRFDQPSVERMRTEAGPLVTASQRQQRPANPEGDFWKKDWFRTYKELPSRAYNGGRDWDTAYTKEKVNAASAMIESYRGPGEEGQFAIYVNDVDWDFKQFPELIEWMKSMTGPHYVEQKASGKSAVQALEKEGIAAEEVPVKGDKLARSSAVQGAVANHRIYVREDIYDLLLNGEGQGLLRVTAEGLAAENIPLDVNDVFVQALHRHLGIHAEKKRKFAVR